ncbi:F-box/LRR-repeat protein At4g29420 isoform X1 [Rhodamnia argentea]|uniref:F-box/LRR-repeat protein At4g29420 isoform X1 n=1 Tax=Rhodamnia argentea TaxID=178133 RepID=A0ABM3HBG2_9MYRT|nr:F-box/LRR-repeat protein At4g29420 isoform X1 [Rhodamnia argentea]
MEDLPQHLILDILRRLTDSADVARCRVVSKTLNSVSHGIESITLLCSLSRYLKSRSPDTKSLVPPFKSLVASSILSWRSVDSISIGIDKSLATSCEDMEEDESEDDMYLMDVGFVEEWLPRVCDGLKALSISDFWVQSCWRRSDVLALVSSCCRSLRELELKNAWLSVDGLTPLPTLTSLTFEFIRLDDEDLSKICTCFPLLQVLNLRGVGGLKEPKIRLPDLRSCQWTVSNVPLSLAIYAPRLVKLRLKCIKPRSLILETPALTDFNLSIVQADDLQVKDLISLKNLKLDSPFLYNLITAFPSGGTVEKLTLNTEFSRHVGEMINVELLFKTFPNASSLTLGPGAWSRLWPSPGGREGSVETKSLKGIVACIVVSHMDVAQSFIASILDKCTNLSDFTILVHHQHADSNLLSNLTKRCTADWPRLKWKFGVFKEATEGYEFTGGWDIVWQRQAIKGAR